MHYLFIRINTYLLFYTYSYVFTISHENPAKSREISGTGLLSIFHMGRGCQQGLWLKQVEEKMEEIYLALDSSPYLPQEHDNLSSGSPLPPHQVPPPGPAAGGEKKLASP